MSRSSARTRHKSVPAGVSSAEPAGRQTAALAACLAVVVFGLYLLTLAPTISNRFARADSGDLASAVATWGIPHPTGYPLYVLVGGAVSHLIPIGRPAFRLNLLSAACSSGAAVLVFLTVLRLSAPFTGLQRAVRYTAAATAALALATSRTIWPQSIVAEVYALELLFAAAIAYLLTVRPADRRWLWSLAFLAGLSLTHHTTIIFSLAGAIVVVLARYRPSPANVRVLAVTGLLFLLPLSLYLLLPWRASQHPASNWGDPSTPGRFIDVITGAQYHYLVDHNAVHAVRAVPAVVRLAFGQFAWWVVPLAVFGVLTLWEYDRPYARYLLLVSLLSAGFVAVYHAEGRETYLLQSSLMLCIAGGIGMLATARWLWGLLGASQRRWLPWIVASAALLTVVPWAGVGLSDFNLRHDWSAWNYARDTLVAAPVGGTIVTDTDETTFPLWYAQRAEHLRPDVHVVDVRFSDPIHQR